MNIFVKWLFILLNVVLTVKGNCQLNADYTVSLLTYNWLSYLKFYPPEMVFIPGGTFVMGSDQGDWKERPVHRVTLSGFYMSKTPVTQKEYERVIGKKPSSHLNCPDCPVEHVSWADANEYCRKVGGRLPTEAEWEYAYRAGTISEFPFQCLDSIKSFDYSCYRTIPVARSKPNRFGLFDMSGNIFEWCNDWFDLYKIDVKDPMGPDSGFFKIFRGGCRGCDSSYYRSAARQRHLPEYKHNNLGFRVVIPLTNLRDK